VDVKNIINLNVQVFFADGLPDGYKQFTSLTLTPKLVSIYPNTGSIGGTLLTITGVGFGVETLGLGLVNGSSSNVQLCEYAKVLGYGKFICFTKPLSVASTNTLKINQGTTYFTCGNTLAPNDCKYSQVIASSPQVTSYSLTGDVLTLTGTNFPADTDYTATVNFKTAFVDVISWTSTSIVGDFSTKGLPFANSSENKVPFIRFTRKSDYVDFLSYSTGLTPLQINPVPTSSSSGVTSSFAGGLSYEISGPRITASLLEPNNRVEVCGNICKLDIQSDNTKAVCRLPPLSTTYSAANFQIGGAGLIQGKWSGSVPLEVPKITDGVWPSEYNDPNANCWLEIDFPETQIAVLDNVKVLINNLNTLKTPFAGVTKLQGWDGA